MSLSTKVNSFIQDVWNAASVKDWADDWGRSVGIGGVTTKEGRWPAGDDDELDAFRHAFISALLKAWDMFFGAYPDTAEMRAAFLGWLNEAINTKPNGTCSRQMDEHNNEVGRSLAPSALQMWRWMLSGTNPHQEIAESVAAALRDGRLIDNFDDPRMDKHCRPQAKVQGEFYVWRTQEDDDVRWEHVVRNGQVFSWTQPPAGGHPGADYGCRCWAEPLDSRYDSEFHKVFKK